MSQQSEQMRYLEACRQALADAGWSFVDDVAPGRPPRVLIRRGAEQMVIGHPGGLLETYIRLCRFAGVSPRMRAG